MILSDRDIRTRLEAGDLEIEPIEDPELQIQPASVDLRLRSEIDLLGCPLDRFGGSRRTGRYLADGVGPLQFQLQPGEFALGCTIERVKLPADLAGRVEGRSSLGRLGLLVHVSAGFIDPGFDGEITLELANLSGRPVPLIAGMRIAQIVFHQMTGPADLPYGAERGSKYQHQRGPTRSKMASDRL